MSAERRITVWLCDECGYWRKDEATGVHVTTNPKEPGGKLIRHTLRAEVFVQAKP